MTKELIHALQTVTGKSNMSDVPLEQWQQLAEAYPYFGAVQLMLAKKMKEEQHPNAQKQWQKTALYFPSQQWLRYLLLANDEQTVAAVETKEEPVEHREEDVENASPISVSEKEQKQSAAAEAKENIAFKNEESNSAAPITEQSVSSVPSATSIAEEPEEAPLDEEERQQQESPLPMEEANQKIASLLSQQAAQFSQPVKSNAEDSVSTEPFHTVDYFASQGINLDAKREDNHFDKKVHKFTDWLRQMKRINPHPVDLGTETEQETFVAHIADSSNYTKEVLTESMANVLLKQGKREKAIEVYQKLSLLNPDKSTYFANLIQQITQ